ncbi:MAG TPA: hypothetical protein VGM83_03030, partial [Devosiaceae bacterium]
PRKAYIAADDEAGAIVLSADGAIGVVEAAGAMVLSEAGAIGAADEAGAIVLSEAGAIGAASDDEAIGAASEDDAIGASDDEVTTAELEVSTVVVVAGPRLKIQIRPMITITTTMMIIQVLRFMG